MRKRQSLFVIGVLVFILVGAHIGGVDVASAGRNLAQDCAGVLRWMWDYFTDIFRMT
jgi:hypothetical protein